MPDKTVSFGYARRRDPTVKDFTDRYTLENGRAIPTKRIVVGSKVRVLRDDNMLIGSYRDSGWIQTETNVGVNIDGEEYHFLIRELSFDYGVESYEVIAESDLPFKLTKKIKDRIYTEYFHGE